MTTAHVLKLIDDPRSDTKSAFESEMSRRLFWEHVSGEIIPL